MNAKTANNIYYLYGIINQSHRAILVDNSLVVKEDGVTKYTIKEDVELSIYNADNELLADNMSPDNVIDFIRNDTVTINRNAEGFITGFDGCKRTVKIGEEPKITQKPTKSLIDEKTERIIRMAASKQGVSDVDNFLKKIKANKNADVGKTKRVKRKLDLDMDLD